MRGRTKRALIASVMTLVLVVAMFFLPAIPAKVNANCIYCAGTPELPVSGFSSAALYLSGYGGILIVRGGSLSDLYCVAYGNSLDNSCGIGLSIAGLG
jgi:hypothetical protein